MRKLYAIGKAKQLLKASKESVPISVYNAFAVLTRKGETETDSLSAWNAVIGLRNRIVDDYMNTDMQQVFDLVTSITLLSHPKILLNIFYG